jgi:hypothetical protein
VTVPPICVSFEVTHKRDVLISDGFNCDSLATAVAALRAAADRLEETEE